MSMCMYLKSGMDLEIHRLARDADALAALAMSRFGGAIGFPQGRGPTRAPSIDAQQLEGVIGQMSAQAKHMGWLQRIAVYFLARRMRRQLASMKSPARSKATASGSAPLDLHKSWHILHYLFTGSADGGAAPADTLLAGGREVGEDLGYGPPRVLDSAGAQAFASFLDTVTVADLQTRIDARRMEQLGIYCAEDGDAADLAEEVAHYLPLLKDYVAAAAARRECLVIWLM